MPYENRGSHQSPVVLEIPWGGKNLKCAFRQNDHTVISRYKLTMRLSNLPVNSKQYGAMSDVTGSINASQNEASGSGCPANSCYPDKKMVPKGTDRPFSGVAVLPDTVSKIEPGFRYLIAVDANNHLYDEKNRTFNEEMFEGKNSKEKYLESFCNGMNYVYSDDFQINDFSCIKKTYDTVSVDAKMCVPIITRDVRIDLISAEDIDNKKHDLSTKYQQNRFYFNLTDRTLNINKIGKLKCYQFKQGIDAKEKSYFVDYLKNKNMIDPDKLINLFENIGESVGKELKYRISATHPPGNAELYFPNHKYPEDFSTTPRLTREEMEFMDGVLVKNERGELLPTFILAYKSEDYLVKLYNKTVEKFGIIDLKSIINKDEQIARIAGFVARMKHLHPFTDANNRIWIQIVMNRLLRDCGQSETILAVPNGFSSYVRYALKDDPPVGSVEYMGAMKLSIDAVKAGMTFYQSLCK